MQPTGDMEADTSNEESFMEVTNASDQIEHHDATGVSEGVELDEDTLDEDEQVCESVQNPAQMYDKENLNI